MVTTGEAIVDGAAAVVVRGGLAAVTLEAVATEAGVSRATVYRWFPDGRRGVLDALVVREIAQMAQAMVARLETADDLAEGLASLMAWAGPALDTHELLQAALDSDPAELAGHLDANDGALHVALREAIWHRVVTELPGRPDPEADAEYVATMVLSHASNPGVWRLDDPTEVAELVHTVLLGWAVVGAAPTTSPGPVAGRRAHGG